MTKKVKCPTCGRPAVWSSDNPYRPFCSDRCRLIDLGAWADEKYVIPGKVIEADDDLTQFPLRDRVGKGFPKQKK